MGWNSKLKDIPVERRRWEHNHACVYDKYKTCATYMSCQWWRQKVPPFPASGCERWSGIGCWEWGHRSTVGKHHLPGSLPASDHLQVKNKTKNGLKRMFKKFRSTVIKSKQAQIPLNELYLQLLFCIMFKFNRFLSELDTKQFYWRWQSALLKGTLKVSCWSTGAAIMYCPAQTCTCKNNWTLSITTIRILL